MISLKIFSGICSTDKVEAAVSLEVVLAEAEDSEAASAAISGETSAAAACKLPYCCQILPYTFFTVSYLSAPIRCLQDLYVLCVVDFGTPVLAKTSFWGR